MELPPLWGAAFVASGISGRPGGCQRVTSCHLWQTILISAPIAPSVNVYMALTSLIISRKIAAHCNQSQRKCMHACMLDMYGVQLIRSQSCSRSTVRIFAESFRNLEHLEGTVLMEYAAAGKQPRRGYNMAVRGTAEASSGESRIALIARQAHRLLTGDSSLEEAAGESRGAI